MDKNVKPLKDLLDSVREIEGFPIGKDEDILALSDPPYYTACPNPYVNDFIDKYGKPYDEQVDDYHRDPYLGDISEGKKNKIYNIHSYHTKVPHKAIIPFIEHYTNKGDIVLDCFAGTGMTAIAAKLLGRHAIVADLSSIASFIANNMNNLNLSYELVSELLDSILDRYSWMYTTKGENGKDCNMNFTVWSECFNCPYCSTEFDFFQVAIDLESGQVKEFFKCPSCSAKLTKKECERALVEIKDELGKEPRQTTKVVPALISYEQNGSNKFKEPDESDLKIIDKINDLKIPDWFPFDEMLGKGNKWGDSWRAGYHIGITQVNHFYIKRTLVILAALYNGISKMNQKEIRNSTLFTFTASIMGLSILQRYRHNSAFPNMILSGTLYVGSVRREWNPINWYKGKFKSVLRSIKDLPHRNDQTETKCLVSTQSATDVQNIPSNSCDYIFTDPPFGDNLLYSELNYIWEAWLKVKTCNTSEAIINSSQGKGLLEYSDLLRKSFRQYYRILKPNRWVTVVFHNSKSNVWNVIQNAIIRSGFIIAQISILDKKQGSFKQITSAGAVKNDLIINAYKPKISFESKFLSRAGDGLEQEFIKMHLSHLNSEPTVERTEQMLYSKMLAYYVQHSYTVKYNSKTFFQMLKNHFKEEDGFWFNPDQLTSYREFKKKMKLEGIDSIKVGQSVMFVQDEKSALIWLHAFLDEPKDFQAIHPAFTKIATIGDDQVPELLQLLEDNFVNKNGKYGRPTSEDEKFSLTEKRERSLRKEFDQILLESKGPMRKFKDCRIQAIVYGFEQCYKEERYQDILSIAKKLDKNILENNSEVTEFIEVAEIKIHGV